MSPQNKKENNTIAKPDDLGCSIIIDIGRYEIEAGSSFPYPNSLFDNSSQLFICEFCLYYSSDDGDFRQHKDSCTWTRPCGKEIYNSEGISVFEVDGSCNKTYCTNLCLLVRLFLKEKKLSVDVSDFFFYILTVNDDHHHNPYRQRLAGYFSKEKHPDFNNNLSCILTLPPYQRQGFGRFLIDFSYLLSRIENVPGSPEKPLSQVGLLTYQNYWCACISSYLYAHLKEKSITVQSISDHTGIDPYDVADTLQVLDVVNERNGKLCIVVRKQLLQEQMKSFRSKNYICLNVDCLDWKPLVQENEKEKKSTSSDIGNDSGKRQISLTDECVASSLSKKTKRENPSHD